MAAEQSVFEQRHVAPEFADVTAQAIEPLVNPASEACDEFLLAALVFENGRHLATHAAKLDDDEVSGVVGHSRKMPQVAQSAIGRQ